MDNRPIGVLDSGVGGLSLLPALRRLLPDERFVALADGRFFPYGEGDPAWVADRAAVLSGFLIARDAKLILVACNTASVHALAHLRGEFPDRSFVGVVPVIKTLASRSRTKTIAMLSTPATAESDYLRSLIEQFAAGMRVVNIPCPGLAELVEAGELNSQRVARLLETYAAMIRDSGADVLGLGCTHYLFLRPVLKRLLGRGVRIYDPSRPVARRVKQVLAEQDRLAEKSNGDDEYFTTGEAGAYTEVARRLLRCELPAATKINL